MALAYGIIAVISLCMVGMCVVSDKKRNEWLIWLFVSVSVCNLGYFMVSVSIDLGSALNSNRISYLGSVFLPFFLLMMVLRLCKINCKRWITALLVGLGIIMLGITTSPGILPIYYSTVDIEFVDGGAKLVREYGPLHKLYYAYLGVYMLSMAGIAVYAVVKKKIKSRMHIFLLISAVFCNIVIWLAEQFLPRGFEWLSVSYILTEGLILLLYRSMKKHGHLADESKPSSYTVNVLLVIYLLLFASFIRMVTTDASPVMYTVSQVVVLIIYIGILVFWGIAVYDRIVHKIVRRYLLTLVALMMLWMLMRTLRHTVFRYVFPVGQWCWYAYYISMILIPQICFMSTKYIGKPEGYRMSPLWQLLNVTSVILIVLILTNDLHQWAFRFIEGYEAGWDIYERGFLYNAAVVWIFTCIVMMIVTIVKNCRVPKTHKFIWRPVAMLGVGVLYTILYTVDIELFKFIEMTAALCFTVVAIWESCIKTGLVSSNTHYDELLKKSSLGVAVVDNNFTAHYRSDDALVLNEEQMKNAEKTPIVLDGGIRVSSSPIRGGYTFWQEDISELLDILEELTELHEQLRDSNAVSMENYRIDKQIRSLVEKNRLYDELHRQTSHQINLLNNWLKVLVETDDSKKKRELLCRIVVVGAYLKRRNNLILVHEQDGSIKAEELSLSLDEMMKNLLVSGINCACSVQFENSIPSGVAMKLFDFYEFVVENTFDGLESLLARFFCRDGSYYACIDVVCTLDITKLEDDSVSVSVSDENCYTLSFCVKEGDGI